MRRGILYWTVVLATFCFVLVGCGQNAAPGNDSGGSADASTNAGYESSLFDTGYVHQVDVQISEEDWADLLANPTEKTKYHVDVAIDGEEVKDASFSTKGNSSLYFVAAEGDSSRYSFRVNFGKYVEGQTYRGLDVLSLNNCFSDPAYMKDYLSYEVFRQVGVPAPLMSYAWVTINGEDQGLYAAVEDEKESFLTRTYNGEGVIYKPESKDVDLSLDRIADIQENGLSMEEESCGSDLVYRDDNPESYPDIFENAETKAGEQDAQDVIAALKSLSEGTNLDSCLDTDGVIRFFAAHNFLLNYDSYTGTLAHNVVLYENKGKLSYLPWDYNLAFGGFVPIVGEGVLSDATDILNRGIDSPLIGVAEDDRPMWAWVVRDDAYLQEYHEVLDALVAGYFESGAADQRIRETSEMLLPYVEKDPTAFCSVDEFKTGCEALRQFCELRAESVRKQLDGGLSPVAEDQESRDKVDASDFNLMDLGVAISKAA
ncbi:MAG: CotH kinase family protein [Coriobacteriia bacterium]|nr:CotH kinase family protein [Coriobacteriia bacterium]